MQNSSDRHKMNQQIAKKKKEQRLQTLERRKYIIKDIVYMTQMYSIKMVLSSVFKPRNHNEETSSPSQIKNQMPNKLVMTLDDERGTKNQFCLLDALQRVNDSMPYGAFSNTCAMEMLKKIHISINEIITDFLPQKNKQIPIIDALFSKYMLKNDILRSDERALILNGHN